MDWSLALYPNGAKQDPAMNDAEFGVIFLAKSLCTASIQEGLDCLGPYYLGLEGERYSRLVVRAREGIV